MAEALSVGESTTDVSAATVEVASDRLTASMRILWKLPWENERKETFWRLRSTESRRLVDMTSCPLVPVPVDGKAPLPARIGPTGHAAAY